MARTKKMADPYPHFDVLAPITRAINSAEVSLDSFKVAKAETSNLVAKFTLLKKENEELRHRLFRMEEKLKQFYKFKDEAEDTLKALSAIKKLCSDCGDCDAVSDEDVDIQKMPFKRARVDNNDSDSEAEDALKALSAKEAKLKEITVMLEAAKQSEKESQAQLQQDLAAAFPKKATKSASPPKRSSGYSLFPASSPLLLGRLGTASFCATKTGLNVDDEEEEDDSELCPDCPEPHLPGLPPGSNSDSDSD
jgi:hypothetical protein